MIPQGYQKVIKIIQRTKECDVILFFAIILIAFWYPVFNVECKILHYVGLFRFLTPRVTDLKDGGHQVHHHEDGGEGSVSGLQVADGVREDEVSRSYHQQQHPRRPCVGICGNTWHMTLHVRYKMLQNIRSVTFSKLSPVQ